jgi:hypothetical protein
LALIELLPTTLQQFKFERHPMRGKLLFLLCYKLAMPHGFSTFIGT